MNRALITGISGQDGSYLAEFLVNKGYRVFGLVRRTPESLVNLQRILSQVELLYGDLRDASSLASAISRADPDEIYNLAGQSFVPPSWIYPHETLDINAGGLGRILSLVSTENPQIKVYQASSSEMFGNQVGALDESSSFLPSSPYGASKEAAHQLIQVYRGKGVRAVGGILFNHESERRGTEMVTMKICRHVARFSQGHREPLELGNLKARRDWGYAPDYVEAMFLMMRQAKEDYVIGTGLTYSVEDCLGAALNAAGLDLEEFKAKWLVTNTRLQRTGEINILCANTAKACKELGWKPTTTFNEMIRKMVNSELRKQT